MTVLPLVFACGWASGLNAYLVVLVLGVAGLVSHAPRIPDQLTRPEVLATAGLLLALDLVMDKVAHLDTAWDIFSTVLRPGVAGALGGLLAAQAGAAPVPYVLLGAGTALVAHLAKTATRLAVTGARGWLTRVGTSVVEDVLVLLVTILASAHPWTAMLVAGILLILGTATAVTLAPQAATGWRTWRGRPA